MKNLILSGVLLAGLVSSSLSVSGQILRGGINFANVTFTDDGEIDETKVRTSFQIGLSGNFRLAGPIYLQPGVFFTGKGSKTESGDDDDQTWFKATSNPYYIEVPVNLIFKSKEAPVRFFAGAGPYVGIGIAGKNKVEGKYLGTSFSSEEKIEWSKDDPTTFTYEEGAGLGRLRRFDYGLNGTAGLEFNKFILSANYGLGLAKLQSGTESDDDNNNKHRVFSILIGLRF
jgi:hypothetical protein